MIDAFTTPAIASLVYYLGKTMLNKSFETTIQELSKDGLKWMKSVFHRADGTPKDVLANLQNNPEDKHNIQAAELEVQKALIEKPEALAYIDEIYEVIKKKEAIGEFKTIINAKIVNTGNVNTHGGDFIQVEKVVKKMDGNHFEHLQAGESIKISINQQEHELKSEGKSQKASEE